MTHRGAVYFARGLDSGLVKIGFSRSVRWRVRSLAIEAGEALEVLAAGRRRRGPAKGGVR